MDEKLELTLEQLEKVIQSAVGRVVHNTPSPKTLELIDGIKTGMNSAIKQSIKETVNGKIDKLTITLDEHIVQHTKDTEEMRGLVTDIIPVIEAYKEEKALNAATKRIGEKAIFISKVIGAIGVIGAAALYALNKANAHLP